MKIGLMTESLGDMPFEAVLATCAEMGIEAVEFGTGNWFAAPFIDLDGLIESAPKRRDFLARIADHDSRSARSTATATRSRPASRASVTMRCFARPSSWRACSASTAW